LTLSLDHAYSQVHGRDVFEVRKEITMNDNLRIEGLDPCFECGGMGVPSHGVAAVCSTCSGLGAITIFPVAPEAAEQVLTSRARELRNLGDEATDPRQAAELLLTAARIWEALARQTRATFSGVAVGDTRSSLIRERLSQLVRLACLLYTASGLSPWPCLATFTKDLPRTGFSHIMTACRRAGARGFPHEARAGDPSPGFAELRALLARQLQVRVANEVENFAGTKAANHG
jgi:hypothetical protein